MDRIIYIFVFFASISCYSQDTTYLKKFPDKLAVRTFALNTSHEFLLDYVGQDLQIAIVPNQKTTLNVGVQYDIVAISFGFAPTFLAENKDNADSKMLSFSTAFYPGRFVQLLDLQYQKGMSLEEVGNEDNSTYLAKMKSLRVGGSTSYVFNRNFSFMAMTLQNAKQLKSVGSWTVGLSYAYTELDAKDVPEIAAKMYMIDVAAEGGYYYNWVIARDFQLSVGGLLGVGVSETDDGPKYTSPLARAGLIFAPGYNGERFFTGAMIRAFASNRDTEAAVNVEDVTSYATFFLGYRFDAPPFLKRQKDNVKNKLKL